MSLRSLLLGLLLGFGAGWVASSLARPGHEPEPPAPGRSPSPAAYAPEPAVLTGAPESVRPMDARPDLPTLRRRLAEARAASDGDALREALRGLGELSTPEGDAVLLALVRDRTLLLTDELARGLVDWLKDSEAEGVADAAKARFAIRREAGHGPVSAGSGWFALIGARGGRATLDWAREEGWAEHDPLWRELVTGLLGSDHPDALVLAKELATADPTRPHDWPEGLRQTPFVRAAVETWARREPATGIPEIVAQIEELLEPPYAPLISLDVWQLWPIYARCPPDASLPDAYALIRKLASSPRCSRVAWPLMRMLGDRGLDLAPGADVVRQPTELLEEIATRGGPRDESETNRVQVARIRILDSPWAWSDRSLRAVERSIPWERDEADRDVLRARLLEVRAARRWGESD